MPVFRWEPTASRTATRSEIDGTAGDQRLGKNEETSTGFGTALRLGLGFPAGPGQLHVEAELDYVPIDQLITGDDNVSSLAFAAGYTQFF